MKRIYLAGPIAGLTYSEATHGWRQEVSNALAGTGIQCYSPMRGKVFLKDHAGPIGKEGYEQHPMSRMQGILGRDRNDVMEADLIFMNVQGAKSVSIGTTVELGWADAFRKPIVLVTDKEGPHNHAFFTGLATYVCHDVATAIDCTKALLLPGYE